MLNLKRKKAQALLELAVLGAILITLLGVLLKYGLKNKYQQQAMQRGFRKAMAWTQQKPVAGKDEPRYGKADYAYISDRHIPDPSNSFGIGPVDNFNYSASVVKDYELQETARTEAYLPQIVINIPNNKNGVIEDQVWTVSSAGFIDFCVPKKCGEGHIVKLEEIYGYSSIWEYKQGEEQGIEDGEPRECNGSLGTVFRAIDSCNGEIMSYDGCLKQCKMFDNGTDPVTKKNICIDQCELARLNVSDSEKSCERICQASLDPIGGSSNKPWYCGEIENIFGSTILQGKRTALGLQSDYDRLTQTDNVMTKTESKNSIQTTDDYSWTVATTRKIFLIRNKVVQEKPVTGTVSYDAVSDLEKPMKVDWK